MTRNKDDRAISNITEINPKKDNPMQKYAIQFEEDGIIWASSIEAKNWTQAESLISGKAKVLGLIVGEVKNGR